jgi:hypothetical protein
MDNIQNNGLGKVAKLSYLLLHFKFNEKNGNLWRVTRELALSVDPV